MKKADERLRAMWKERLAKTQRAEAEAKAKIAAQQEQDRLAKVQQEEIETKAKLEAQREQDKLAQIQQDQAKEVVIPINVLAKISKDDIDMSIKKALKAVMHASKILQSKLTYSMEEKVKALNELKEKENAAKSNIELKLKIQGQSCDGVQLNALFKEFKDCSLRYEDNKTLYENFDVLINDCTGKCFVNLLDNF